MGRKGGEGFLRGVCARDGWLHVLLFLLENPYWACLSRGKQTRGNDICAATGITLSIRCRRDARC